MTAPPIHWRYPGSCSSNEKESGQFCQSSIADKMSDYEDIWNDTMTLTRSGDDPAAAAASFDSRSMTPAESETQLKTYLASKLMGGSSPVDHQMCDSGGSAATAAGDSSSSFCSVAFNSQHQSSSISNSSSNSLTSKSSYISSTVTSVSSTQSSASSSVPLKDLNVSDN